jgi:hypothetical protein
LLKLGGTPQLLTHNDEKSLVKRSVSDAADELPVELLAGTYIPEENRIRETTLASGARVLTFSSVLQYNLVPLPNVLIDILSMGEEGMGCPVEVEFSVNLYRDKAKKSEFAVLKIRPMSAGSEFAALEIAGREIEKAFCYSQNALGDAKEEKIRDILYVKRGRIFSTISRPWESPISRCQTGKPTCLTGRG